MSETTEVVTTDLAGLRKVAEAATPGPWRAVEGDLEGKPVSAYARTLFGNREKDATTSGRLFLTLASNDIDPERGAEVVPALTGDGPRSQANAEHIATFDPPTVLALLDAIASRDARLAAVEALFAGGPDTPCRTSWRMEPGVLAMYHASECVEVPMDDLRAALSDPDEASTDA